MKRTGESGFAEEADSVLTKFALERMQYSAGCFRARVISYIYLNHAGEELLPFLQAASHMAEINIKIHTFFRNPFRCGESFLIFILIEVVALGVFSALYGEPTLAIILLSGALVQTLLVARHFAAEYVENEVKVYIYRELKEIVDGELASIANAPQQ